MCFFSSNEHVELTSSEFGSGCEESFFEIEECLLPSIIEHVEPFCLVCIIEDGSVFFEKIDADTFEWKNCSTASRTCFRCFFKAAQVNIVIIFKKTTGC